MKINNKKFLNLIHTLIISSGEDRWLCTLLLQQGHRVEYCAASDALTQAPEQFREFFNQRRRWAPSTMANIMDLLGSVKSTCKVNDNISYIYMIYQGFLMISGILGSATILLMIAGSFNAVFRTNLMWSYIIALLPIVVYMIICMTAKPDFQLNVAAILSAVYAMVMMAVLAGTFVQLAQDGVISPNGIFLSSMICIFLISGLMHPMELWCLLPGVLYFICIPTTFLLLNIYAFCNLHVVSWGTREVPKKRNQAERVKQIHQAKAAEPKNKILAMIPFNTDTTDDNYCCGLGKLFRDCCNGGRRQDGINEELLRQIVFKLDRLEEGMAELYAVKRDNPYSNVPIESAKDNFNGSVTTLMLDSDEQSVTDALLRRLRNKQQQSDDLRSLRSTPVSDPNTTESGSDSAVAMAIPKEPEVQQEEAIVALDDGSKMMTHSSLGNGPIDALSEKERSFWEKVIEKYLHPLAKDGDKEKKLQSDLIALRNNMAFAYFMINAIWIIIMFMMQQVQEALKDFLFIPIPRPGAEPLKLEPLSFVFLLMFAIVLLLQFVAMIFHRYGTFLHILASTELSVFRKKKLPDPDSAEAKTMEIKNFIELTKDMMTLKGIDDEPEIEPASGNFFLVSNRIGSTTSLRGPSQNSGTLPKRGMKTISAFPQSVIDNISKDYGPENAEGRGSGSKRTKTVPKNTLHRAFVKRYKQYEQVFGTMKAPNSSERDTKPDVSTVRRNIKTLRRMTNNKNAGGTVRITLAPDNSEATADF